MLEHRRTVVVRHDWIEELICASRIDALGCVLVRCGGPRDLCCDRHGEVVAVLLAASDADAAFAEWSAVAPQARILFLAPESGETCATHWGGRARYGSRVAASALARTVYRLLASLPRSRIGDPRFAAMVTQCPAFERVRRLIEIGSQGDDHVLLEGESGTGKEIAARMIHQLSPRSDRLFLAVNVASLGDNLFESELFGVRRGAYTGADADRAGLIEQAGDGTLFIDELQSASPHAQAALLRALQERCFRRVGGLGEQRMRCGIILAANVSLADLGQRGEFRQDLFFRINGMRIDLPPLRDRHGDVPLLIEHFLAVLPGECALLPCGITPAAVRCLETWLWPGNVRELRDVLKRAMTLCSSGTITLDDLPAELRNHRPPSLDDIVGQYLDEVLEQTGGNQTWAAEIIQVPRERLNQVLSARAAPVVPNGPDRPGNRHNGVNLGPRADLLRLVAASVRARAKNRHSSGDRPGRTAGAGS